VVNGFAATLTSGTPQAGTWRATVPVALPVAPGGALVFDVRAFDAAGNEGARIARVDNDGTPSAMDRNRGTGADESDVHSTDFNTGTTAGTLFRNGWTTRLSSGALPGGIRATVTGAGTVARVTACTGADKEVRLDAPGETADVLCNGTTITVRALTTTRVIEVLKRQPSNTWTVTQLKAGSSVSTGSPTTASPDNTEPIDVELLQGDPDGRRVAIGSFRLAPGDSVDVSPDLRGDLALNVLRGTVVFTVRGVTTTLGPGQPLVVPVDRTPPSITISSPRDRAAYVLNEPLRAVFRCEDPESGVAACDGSTGADDAVATNSVGTHQLRVQGADSAGNSASETVAYDVTYAIVALDTQRTDVTRGTAARIAVRLADAERANQSSANVGVRATAIESRATGDRIVLDEAFRYDEDQRAYAIDLETTRLERGEYRLLFEVSGDPVTHEVTIRVR
jgi:hypothetical protein